MEDLCPVTYTGTCQPYCTFTQGFWGNAGGFVDGLSTTEILEDLLEEGPIFIGDGEDCGFLIPDAQCVLNLLPGGGRPRPLLIVRLMRLPEMPCVPLPSFRVKAGPFAYILPI